MTIFADRVAFETPTTGTGTVDVGDAISPAFFTPAEAGITNGATPIPYSLSHRLGFLQLI